MFVRVRVRARVCGRCQAGWGSKSWSSIISSADLAWEGSGGVGFESQSDASDGGFLGLIPVTKYGRWVRVSSQRNYSCNGFVDDLLLRVVPCFGLALPISSAPTNVSIVVHI